MEWSLWWYLLVLTICFRVLFWLLDSRFWSMKNIFLSCSADVFMVAELDFVQRNTLFSALILATRHHVVRGTVTNWVFVMFSVLLCIPCQTQWPTFWHCSVHDLLFKIRFGDTTLGIHHMNDIPLLHSVLFLCLRSTIYSFSWRGMHSKLFTRFCTFWHHESFLAS